MNLQEEIAMQLMKYSCDEYEFWHEASLWMM